MLSCTAYRCRRPRCWTHSSASSWRCAFPVLAVTWTFGLVSSHEATASELNAGWAAMDAQPQDEATQGAHHSFLFEASCGPCTRKCRRAGGQLVSLRFVTPCFEREFKHVHLVTLPLCRAPGKWHVIGRVRSTPIWWRPGRHPPPSSPRCRSGTTRWSRRRARGRTRIRPPGAASASPPAACRSCTASRVRTTTHARHSAVFVLWKCFHRAWATCMG